MDFSSLDTFFKIVLVIAIVIGYSVLRGIEALFTCFF